MTHPTIDDAPGLTWKPRKNGRWEARWQARTDLIGRGFEPKSARIWCGPQSELGELTVQFIRERCHTLQSEMLVYGRGGIPLEGSFDGTLKSLIRSYQTDKDSPYRKLRYVTKRTYDGLMSRLEDDHGHEIVREIKARVLLRWHETWAENGKVSMGHTLVGMLRTLMTFGATILESDECRTVKVTLHDMKFKMGKPRNERLTADQADMIRAKAHELGKHSIALAQAFQFEGMLRQKDVIGEWVPLSEQGPPTTIIDGNSKWIRGLRWDEIDKDLVLRHVTSKRQKEIEIDLKNSPMVLEELALLGVRPASGPIVISERLGEPWHAIAFRRAWRDIADKCGIPKAVKNMDSRAGAISEATDAGADLEHVRHAATHSDIGMTQRYSRGATEKVAGVQLKRVAFRNKSGTESA